MTGGPTNRMNSDDFRARCGLEVTTLEVWLEQRWLVPDRSAADAVFTEIDVARARLIRDLTGGMGVNDEGVGLILHLVDQIHGLRRALAQVRNESPSVPERD